MRTPAEKLADALSRTLGRVDAIQMYRDKLAVETRLNERNFIIAVLERLR